MRVFKVKAFHKWAEGLKLNDTVLHCAVREMADGLIDADLGAGICKKRIAVNQSDKSNGARTIVGFRTERHVFFLYGFRKNERENIDRTELRAFRQYAESLFGLSDSQIEQLTAKGELVEVDTNGK